MRWILAALMPISIYLALPILNALFPSLIRFLFFLNIVKNPFVDFDDLSKYGVQSTGRNFHIHGILGCWHILPSTLSKIMSHKKLTAEDMEYLMSAPNYPIIIYLHGNSYDRSEGTRTALYNVLSTMDLHIIAIDYRGFGDSPGCPNETGLIEDARETFSYVKEHAGNNHIYMWGHSMGTGVATAAAMQLSINKNPPNGLILESPFNNLRDAVALHPTSAMFRWLPWFHSTLIKPISRSGLKMNSDERIAEVSCPILIMHASDDHIIPVELSHRLRDSATKAGRDVTYVEFDASRKLQHKYIHLAAELPTIIRDFMTKCSKDTNPTLSDNSTSI